MLIDMLRDIEKKAEPAAAPDRGDLAHVQPSDLLSDTVGQDEAESTLARPAGGNLSEVAGTTSSGYVRSKLTVLHGGDARAASGFALGGLEHPIEGLDEAVGRLVWSRAAEAWATRWNLSKVTRAFGSWSGTPLIKALDIVDADRADFAQASPCVRPGV